jgi:hypothetical protein
MPKPQSVDPIPAPLPPRRFPAHSGERASRAAARNDAPPLWRCCWGLLPASFETFFTRRKPRIAGYGPRCLIAVTTLGVEGSARSRVPARALSHQTEIKTFDSPASWTTTQLLTVSSQIQNPISVDGRILDVSMEFYSILVIVALASAIGTLLQERGQEM